MMRKLMISVDERTFTKLQFISQTLNLSVNDLLTQAVVTPDFLACIDDLFLFASRIGPSFNAGDKNAMQKAIKEYLKFKENNS